MPVTNENLKAISVSQLSKTFISGGVVRKVFSRFTIEFEGGAVTAIMGQSGVGKSTLLRLLAGLDAPDEGQITRCIESQPLRYAFQSNILLPWRTVAGNLKLSADLTGNPTDPREVQNALKRIGLSDFAGAFPSELSGGMRRRVALARTVLSDFQTILLDEPLSGVDLPLRIELLVWLRQLIGARQATSVVVMHDLEDAIQIADRIVVLQGQPASVAVDCPIELARPTSVRAAWALRRSPGFFALAEQLASELLKMDKL